MKFKKYHIAVITGGASVEHEISIQSAQKIITSIIEHHEITLIYITREGAWRHIEDVSLFMTTPPKIETVEPLLSKQAVTFFPYQNGGCLMNSKGNVLSLFDVALPMCHGTYGEDGCLQGMLNMLNIPFIGSDVLGASIAMNKALSKELVENRGIHVARHLLATHNFRPSQGVVEEEIGYPLFVKPNNLGSSLGISHVHEESELYPAINKALCFDHEVLIEEAITGREIECGILVMNGLPHVGVPGEIRSPNHFYSFSEKYLSSSKSQVCCPADIEPTGKAQYFALEAYRALKLQSFARIDFFLDDDGTWYFNEANPIPGFTDISMFPLSIQASGVSYMAMFEAMLEYAFIRHKKKQKNLHMAYDEKIYS